MVVGTSLSHSRDLAGWAAVVCVALTAPPARAEFHLWQIQEVYSNSSGTLQFIEMVDQFGAQNFIGFGSPIQVSDTTGTQTHTFPIPFGDVLPGDSLNHMLLFGTSGIHAAGGPTPDYIIPNGFLFTGGGSISFFGLNSGSYGTLPTDGTQSLDWLAGTNNAVNSPVNYLGQTGTVSPVPEPTTLVLAPVAAVLGGVYHWRRRRAASPPVAG
jgi:hypothetical protein